MLTTFNAVIIIIVAATTLAVMVAWHAHSRGAWRCYPAGRSVMGLLAIQFVILANAAVSTLVGTYEAKPLVYGALYTVLEGAVLGIGLAVLTASRPPSEGRPVGNYRKPGPAQVRYPWRSTLRTVLWAVVAFAAMAPLIYTAATQHEPEAAVGWAATALAVLGAVQRVMTLPVVDEFLRRYLPWLAASPRDDEDE